MPALELVVVELRISAWPVAIQCYSLTNSSLSQDWVMHSMLNLEHVLKEQDIKF